jgi:hypothetical protein
VIKDFKTKKTDGRLLIQKTMFGLGFNIDFASATFHRQIFVSIAFDMMFIRFWINFYKN